MKNIIVLAVSTVVLIVCSVIIVVNLGNFGISDIPDTPDVPDNADSVGEIVKTPDFEISFLDLAEKYPLVPESGSTVYSDEVLPQWEELYGKNADFKGWLKIGETVVDYPLLQVDGDDTDFYYLHRGFDKTYLYDGSLFIDAHTPIKDSRRPDNTVIYGHNLKNGRMFGSLTKYYTPVHGMGEYTRYPTMEFSTVYDDERNTYKIFAGMYVNTLAEHGEVFYYFTKRIFRSQNDFLDFVENVLDRSVFYTDVDLQYGDEILTLSTCYYPLGNETDRFVLFARRVREGESEEVDTSVAYANPNPKYFDYYYKVKGGKWNGRTWDTSKVKNYDEYSQLTIDN
ncbi:MAG: class B sortase [Oscillospiraceae bacterium]|nr:class B sortase [Oscillospiraceae bacterium]